MSDRRVIGYVFDQPGGYYKDKYYFEGTAEKIATFLYQNSPNRIIITDCLDITICETTSLGVVLDYADEEYAVAIQQAILELFEKKQIKLLEFDEKYPRYMEEVVDQ